MFVEALEAASTMVSLGDFRRSPGVATSIWGEEPEQKPTLHWRTEMFSADLKRGSIELLILSVLEREPRHGYQIGKLLEQRSKGQFEFRVSTLYSALYRMEDRGWVKGRWVEREGERRRCFYSLTLEGRATLEARRKEWMAFAAMVNRIIGVSPA